LFPDDVPAPIVCEYLTYKTGPAAPGIVPAGRDPPAIRGPRALFHVLGAPGPIESKMQQNQQLAGRRSRAAAPLGWRV